MWFYCTLARYWQRFFYVLFIGFLISFLSLPRPLFPGVPVVVSSIVYFSVLFIGFLEFGTVCLFPLLAGFGTVFHFWYWVCNVVSIKQLNYENKLFRT
jgi:hypothetical protein